MCSKRFVQASTLDLIFPPIPNSAASAAAKDPQIEQRLRQSDFYMICGRAEATLSDLQWDVEKEAVTFTISVKGGVSDTGHLIVNRLPTVRDDHEHNGFGFAIDRGHLIVVMTYEGEPNKIAAAMTPDHILMLRGRKEYFLSGLEKHQELATYDLLYVGIAKEGDSFDRIFKKGHQARTEILANEPQRYPGARVSDETFLFLFKVEPLLIKTFSAEATIEDGDLDMSYNNKRLIADAEKAFVSILKPIYNRQLYKQYPKGRDGLYGTGLDAYTYSISEAMSFRTPYGEFKGGRDKREHTMSNEADFIYIEGEAVTIQISGVDFHIDK